MGEGGFWCRPKAEDEVERRLVQEERRTRFQKLGTRRVQMHMRPKSSSRVLPGRGLSVREREARERRLEQCRWEKKGGDFGFGQLTPRAIPCMLSS